MRVCEILATETPYQIRACVRSKSPSKTGYLESLGGALTVVENCDLLINGSFDAAVAGCDYVIHCASPFQFTAPGGDGQTGFVDPAVNGTLNVLAAAAASPSVKRVVLTSSCAAVAWQDASIHPDGGAAHVWNEDDWQTDSTLESSSYRLSKRLAEQAAWAFVSRDDVTFDLATICPSFVLGPVLSSRVAAASVKYMKSLLDCSTAETFVVRFGCVDVRDVAAAHVAALTVDTAQPGLKNENGEARFIVSSSAAPLSVVNMLKASAEFGARAGLPAQADTSTTSVTCYDHGRAERFLGIEFRALATTIVDGASSLIAHGIVAEDPMDDPALWATLVLDDTGLRSGFDAGNPLTRHKAFAAKRKGNVKASGLWSCEPGGFPIVSRATTETVFILAGKATITDADGTKHELGKGSWHVLPTGWTGRWDISETLRKLYTITP
jgi:nucleoside-diphosphate-sugar epimerase/uncharacterized cupin superfamily protein